MNKKIKFLSGGEKSRLKLCSLTFTGVNLLILDEPTNHLDIDSREVLEETLSEFEGTLLFVSHDRYFINKLADKIIAIEYSGAKEYNGDYIYYQEEYQKALERQVESAMQDRKGSRILNNSKDSKSNNEIITAKVSRPVKIDRIVDNIYNDKRTDKNDRNNTLKNNSKPFRKLEILEKSIEEMEEKIKKLEELMNVHNCDGNRLKELFDEKERVEKELKLAYSEWENLQE